MKAQRLSAFFALGFATLLVLNGCATNNRATARSADADLPQASGVRSVKPLRAGFEPGTAQIRAIKGRAWVSFQADDWMPLRIGEILRAGAVVRIDPDSHADIFLRKNGPVLRATSDTLFAINALGFKETDAGTLIDTELFLYRGRLLGNVGTLKEGSRYEVLTPSGKAQVKEGT